MKHDEFEELKRIHGSGENSERSRAEAFSLIQDEKRRQRVIRRKVFGDGIEWTINPAAVICAKRKSETEVELLMNEELSRVVKFEDVEDADSLMNYMHERFRRWG